MTLPRLALIATGGTLDSVGPDRLGLVEEQTQDNV
jgi:hypothetical protein